MLASLLTPVFFSISVLCAGRSAAQIGPIPANFARLLAATVFLGSWAAIWGSGWSSSVFPWFFLSGVLGFGIGDVALFLAITRLGPRLSLMLTQCLAAPFAALLEWAWLDTRLSSPQLLAGTVILTGVALALSGKQSLRPGGGWSFRLGLAFGVLSALGQASGAVISRFAFLQNKWSGEWIDPGSSAFQRILGGLLVAGFFFWVVRRFFPRPSSLPRPNPFVAAKWILLNALAGPALGVACYQWALKTHPSGIVLPLVATAPIVVIPLAWLFDGDKPKPLSIAGSILAVAGVILLSQTS